MAQMDKKELRIYIRSEKKRYSEEKLEEMSHRICRALSEHPRILSAEVVLLYWALPDEVRTEELVASLASSGKTVLLPKVVSDSEMTIHRFTSVADLAAGAYGILEPSGEKVSMEALRQMAEKGSDGTGGMVGVIPGMAFDRDGHRLGRGKGYYDRFLSALPGMYRIGVCFPFQLQPEVPAEPWDVKMDEVVCQ